MMRIDKERKATFIQSLKDHTTLTILEALTDLSTSFNNSADKERKVKIKRACGELENLLRVITSHQSILPDQHYHFAIQKTRDIIKYSQT